MMSTADGNLDKFREICDTFSEWWTHYEVRSLCVRRKKKWINLATEVILEHESVPVLKKISALPTLNDFKAIRERKKLASFGSFVSHLDRGIISTGEEDIHVETKEQNGTYVPSFRFSHEVFGVSSHQTLPFGGFMAQDTTGGQIGDVIRDVIRDVCDDFRHIDKELMASAIPYESLQELASEFFMSRTGFNVGLATYVSVSAPIPIQLGHVHGSNLSGSCLSLELVAPSLDALSQVTFGYIAMSKDSTVLSRSAVPLSGKKWCRRGDNPATFAAKMEVKSCNYMRVFLSVCGRIIGAGLIKDKDFRMSNRRVNTHTLFDPQGQKLLESLAGKGRQVSPDHESAISCLFAMCGFIPLRYGSWAVQSEIDVIAFHPFSLVVLAIECTTGLPDTKQKLSKLALRCNHLETTLQAKAGTVLPILATALSAQEIPKGEMVKAVNAGIVVLDVDNIRKLFQIAGQDDNVEKTLEFIHSVMANQMLTYGKRS